VANSYRELLGKDQRLDWGNIVVEIGENRLFLYEGIGGSEEGQRTAYLISMQKMLKLPLMPIVKGLAGVIFYASTNSIYLFGGLTRTKESIMLRDAIKLDCSVKKWSPVPPMPSCRFNFLPTPHGSLILLCGGNEEGSVDLYDPRTNQYQTLAVKVPRNTMFTVKSGEEYWSYSEIEVAVWRDGSVLEYRSLQIEQGWSPNPGQSIVQIRGKVYVLSAGVRGYYEVCQERVSVMKVPAKSCLLVSKSTKPLTPICCCMRRHKTNAGLVKRSDSHLYAKCVCAYPGSRGNCQLAARLCRSRRPFQSLGCRPPQLL